jgi:predicted dienelactone hydrolase
MRSPIILLALVMTAAGVATAKSEPQPFAAGVTSVTVQDAEPFDTMVWYPIKTAEVPFKVGPFVISASRDATIADGVRFPVVLLSHGRKGSPRGHRELAAHLARDGFIVVVPTHIGDSSEQAPPRPQRQILIDRPRQARLSLDWILSDQRFSRSIDTTRISAIGFSAGGYTVLALAGARPNFEQALAYCRAHANDQGSCGPVAAGNGNNATNSRTDIAEPPAMHDPRLKAIVVMDPLSFLFDASGLVSVRMPMLLFRPADDGYLSSKGNALALAAMLPVPPQQIVVSGGHFVFIDPCPPELADTIPMVCKDAPGVDRKAVHGELESAISKFLRENL